MKFIPLKFPDAYLIKPELVKDERGFFSTVFSKSGFYQGDVSLEITECNISYNKLKGTMRGLHYQAYPFEQAKLVRCIKGSIYDVIVDLRGHSPTIFEWHGETLSEKNHSMLYIPKGFAHGFQTLEDDTMVEYLINGAYNPASGRGIPWNDPMLKIDWPMTEGITLSEKDKVHTKIKEKC